MLEQMFWLLEVPFMVLLIWKQPLRRCGAIRESRGQAAWSIFPQHWNE
jgi:hypothetical protein